MPCRGQTKYCVGDKADFAGATMRQSIDTAFQRHRLSIEKRLCATS